MLLDWTEQGVRGARDTIKRAAAARQAFEKAGAKITQAYWTMGKHDLVLIAEAPGDETIAALGLQLGMLGNVRSTTMRAFDEKEMEKVLKPL
jgi:uncharacterized protein with GYD domain